MAVDPSGEKTLRGSRIISISLCSTSVCILASITPSRSEMGSQRYTLIYRASHWTSVPWKPSKTEIAKAIGPSTERTMRKKVRIVSTTSEAARKRNSITLRMMVCTMLCREKE